VEEDINQRCACSSARVCRCLGRLYIDDNQPGLADDPGREPSYLDQTNRLPRAKVSALTAGFYNAAYSSLGCLRAVETRSLVAFGDCNWSGSRARTDRAVLCELDGGPRGDSLEAPKENSECDAPIAMDIAEAAERKPSPEVVMVQHSK
jgi:hypothetical protein